ncbi:hypothetical protein BD560DRAFT_452473 [Blakeslea trispora]|nr:hypothetical protein BD560DRAFT_452473 [Blakeslea trispora]
MVTQFWWDKRIYMCRKSMELCNRMIPLTSKSNEIATSLIQYLHDLSGCLTREIVIQFNQADYTEFAYQPVDSQLTLDRETIKLTVQMIIGLLLKHPEQFPVLLKQLADTVQDIYDDYVTDPMEPIELLFDICCANDDDAIRLLDTVLTIYQEQMHCVYILHQININPHSLFLFFLHRCGSTHDILIDLLIDNSSDFLAYFHRYILYACRDTNQLYASFDDLIIDSDTFQTILANTLRVLGRGGFPYNTRPLMKRLLQLEEQLDPIK